MVDLGAGLSAFHAQAAVAFADGGLLRWREIPRRLVVHLAVAEVGGVQEREPDLQRVRVLRVGLLGGFAEPPPAQSHEFGESLAVRAAERTAFGARGAAVGTRNLGSHAPDASGTTSF